MSFADIEGKKRSAKTARKQRWSVTVIEIHSRIYCGVSFLNARYSAILLSVIDSLLSNRSIAKNGVLSSLMSLYRCPLKTGSLFSSNILKSLFLWLISQVALNAINLLAFQNTKTWNIADQFFAQ